MKKIKVFSNDEYTRSFPHEEFFTEEESVDFETFKTLGIVKNSNISNREKCIVELFLEMIPNLDFKEIGKYLDDKM